MSEKLDELLSFYGRLGRPLSLVEICRLSGEESAKVSSFLEKEAKTRILMEDDGFSFLKDLKAGSGMARRQQDFLFDQKWRKLLKLRHWFNYVPFLDFVFVSGSMVLGNVSEKSDFDVLVGVRAGRIFTARYLTLFIFALLRARRSDDKKGSSPDKFCFNHFVTEETYSKPPYNFYRRELYRNLVPVYGSGERVGEFFKANDWAGASADSLLDLRFQSKRNNFIRQFLETILGGGLGNYLENKILAPIAQKRLGKYILSHSEGGRVVVSNRELEFHFNLPYERH